MKKGDSKTRRNEIRKLLAGSVIAMGVTGGMASAAPILQIKGQAGQSLLGFDAGFLEALAAAGVEVDAISPGKARSKNRGFTLPVSGGVVDLNGFVGEVNHAGGLLFSDMNGNKVKFHNLTVELFEGQPLVTGVVQLNGALVGTLPLFHIVIDGASEIFTQRNGKLKTKNLGLSLTQEASDLLNDNLTFFQAPGEEIAKVEGGAKMRSFKPQYADDDDSDDDSSDDDSSDDDSSDDDSSDDDSSDDDSSDDASSDDDSSDDI